MDQKQTEALKTTVVPADGSTDHLEKATVIEKDPAVIAAMDPQALTPKQQYARLWANLKKDKRYVFWALYVMALVFGWGYDQGLSGVAIAFPEFRKVYGEYYKAGDQFVIPALWQSLWNAASTIGQVFGAFLTGQFADLVGRKAVLWLAVALSIASSFALVFAPNLPVLFVSKLLLGFSVGFSTVTPPLYVTENAPAALRSSLSSLTNVIIVLGFFLSSITGWGSSKIDGTWSYRLAFVMTFLVPTLFAIGLPFLPESPVWYVKRGRDDDARKAIKKLYGEQTDVEDRLDFIKSELEVLAGESDMAKQTSWKAIFSKEHRTRTLVAVLGLQSQNFSGGYFASKLFRHSLNAARLTSARHLPNLLLRAHRPGRSLRPHRNLIHAPVPVQLRFRLTLRRYASPKVPHRRWHTPRMLVHHHRRYIPCRPNQQDGSHSPSGLHDHLVHALHGDSRMLRLGSRPGNCFPSYKAQNHRLQSCVPAADGSVPILGLPILHQP
jgi:MFS family permease